MLVSGSISGFWSTISVKLSTTGRLSRLVESGRYTNILVPSSNHQSSLTTSTQPSSSMLTRPEHSPKLAVPSKHSRIGYLTSSRLLTPRPDSTWADQDNHVLSSLARHWCYKNVFHESVSPTAIKSYYINRAVPSKHNQRFIVPCPTLVLSKRNFSMNRSSLLIGWSARLLSIFATSIGHLVMCLPTRPCVDID